MHGCNALLPERMTPTQRRREIARLLALGLVRLRVKKATALLTQVLEELVRKSEAGSQPSVFAEITDDDIDNLFND